MEEIRMKTGKKILVISAVCMLVGSAGHASSVLEWTAGQDLYGSTQRHILSIGPTLYTYMYDNEHESDVKTLMMGVAAGYVYHGLTGLDVGVDFEYATGDHDGKEMGIRYNNEIDIIDVQARVGYRDIYYESLAITPYLGLGFRSIDEEAEADAGATLMEATHDLFFLSGGVTIASPAEYSHDWSWIAQFEARVALTGNLDEDVDEIAPCTSEYDADYDFADMYGLKGDIGIRRKIGEYLYVRGDLYASWWRGQDVDADLVYDGVKSSVKTDEFDEVTYGLLIKVEFLAL